MGNTALNAVRKPLMLRLLFLSLSRYGSVSPDAWVHYHLQVYSDPEE